MISISNRIYHKHTALKWRHNERDGVWNHRRFDDLLNCLFRRRSNKTSKLRVTGLCERNSPVAGEFPSQWASKAENVSIWWRHHCKRLLSEHPSWVTIAAWCRNWTSQSMIGTNKLLFNASCTLTPMIRPILIGWCRPTQMIVSSSPSVSTYVT